MRCAHYEPREGPAKLGEKSNACNAGHTLFLTGKGHHFKNAFAVHENDIICWLYPDRSLLVLRKADEIHWNMVGHSSHVESPYLRDHAA